ncbi:hypothetical protein AB0L53_36500 [Nonomuraea sp. NPDC052129]|uniref:hypothetical protein n=1 Tax=Nonomuraea sp. NPDC052129 TaxID=3154651 RepID=UPI00343D3099
MTNLFGGAAPFYVKYRPGYGEEAIGCLARAFGPGSRVLDLGCGPGTVAIPLAGAVREVRAEFAMNEFTAANSFQASGEHHDDVLADSPFDRLESSLFEKRLTWDLDAVIGLQLSYSYTTPDRLGDRVAEFTDAVRRVLLAANPSGVWEERAITEVLVARRS